jgi:cell division protein FtsX
MSLTTDALGLGVAAAVVVGSVIQASQAFAELNEETPLTTSLAPLFLASLRALFSVVIPKTDVSIMGPRLSDLGLGKEANVALNGEQVKNLKKWLGWFWGWFFIMIGALVALAAAILTLVNYP